MPDPTQLSIGDKIRFVARPDEWLQEGFVVQEETLEFMDRVIERGSPSRIAEIDEYGTPWVNVRLKIENEWEYHTYGILEETGWIQVRPRKQK